MVFSVICRVTYTTTRGGISCWGWRRALGERVGHYSNARHYPFSFKMETSGSVTPDHGLGKYSCKCRATFSKRKQDFSAGGPVATPYLRHGRSVTPAPMTSPLPWLPWARRAVDPLGPPPSTLLLPPTWHNLSPTSSGLPEGLRSSASWIQNRSQHLELPWPSSGGRGSPHGRLFTSAASLTLRIGLTPGRLGYPVAVELIRRCVLQGSLPGHVCWYPKGSAVILPCGLR